MYIFNIFNKYEKEKKRNGISINKYYLWFDFLMNLFFKLKL